MVAKSQHKTLNVAFREWLEQFTSSAGSAQEFDGLMSRLVLDTNVLVYSFEGAASAKARTAIQLMRRPIATRTGVLNYRVAQEFFNVALRRFSHPMTVAEAEQYLATTFRLLLAVHSSLALYAEALQIVQRWKVSGSPH